LVGILSSSTPIWLTRFLERPAEGKQQISRSPDILFFTRTLVLGVFVVLLAVALHTTYERTEDWKDDKTLFKKAIITCPSSSKMHHQYGQILQNEKNHSGALAHFLRAKEIDPQFCDVDFHIGLHYLHLLDYGTGFVWLRRNLPCLFTAHKAYPIIVQIMEIYLKAPGNASAHDDYAGVLEYIDNKTSSTYYREAGVIYLNKKEFKKSNTSFQNALRVLPNRCDIFYWLGKMDLGLAEKYASEPTKEKAYNKQAMEDFRTGMLCSGEEAKQANAATLTELYTLITKPQIQAQFDPNYLQKILKELKLRATELKLI